MPYWADSWRLALSCFPPPLPIRLHFHFIRKEFLVLLLAPPTSAMCETLATSLPNRPCVGVANYMALGEERGKIPFQRKWVCLCFCMRVCALTHFHTSTPHIPMIPIVQCSPDFSGTLWCAIVCQFPFSTFSGMPLHFLCDLPEWLPFCFHHPHSLDVSSFWSLLPLAHIKVNAYIGMLRHPVVSAQPAISHIAVVRLMSITNYRTIMGS